MESQLMGTRERRLRASETSEIWFNKRFQKAKDRNFVQRRYRQHNSLAALEKYKARNEFNKIRREEQKVYERNSRKCKRKAKAV